jgi:ferredoxin
MAAASLLHLATSISSPRLHLRHHATGLLPRRQKHQEVRLTAAPPRAYKVTIEHGSESVVVEMEEDENILERALDEGLDVPHDCKLGVCMTCPARLVSGKVDQSDGMLSDDVVAQGYALLCAAYPRSDCTIRVIPEDELLQVQLATAND